MRTKQDSTLTRFGGREGAINAQPSFTSLSVALTSIYEGGVGRSSIGIADTPSLMAYNTTSSIINMGFHLPVPLSKLASYTDGGGICSHPTSSLGPRGRERAHWLDSYGIEGLPPLNSLTKEIPHSVHSVGGIALFCLSGRFVYRFAGASWRTKKRASNSHLQPLHVAESFYQVDRFDTSVSMISL